MHGTPLHGIEYALPVASAQIKSCVLIAGLLASGTTTVIEPEPSRDHTERLLARAGCRITRDGDRIELTQHDELELGAIHVPGDPSSRRLPHRRRDPRQGLADRDHRHERELDPHRLRPDRRAHGRAS